VTRVVLRKSNDERGSSGVIGFVACRLACVVYEPTPTPVCTNYDRAWDSALRAAQDAGINLTYLRRSGWRHHPRIEGWH
jgi:hypothetical protein